MRALLVIDFINEIVHPNGKLAVKGYADFVARHDTIDRLNDVIGAFARQGDLVVFVRLAFRPDYTDQPKGSPIFGGAHEVGILQDGTWSTQLIPEVTLGCTYIEVVKNRVSAFHGTGLARMLRDRGVTDVYIAGVATDLAVEATARSAHDEDFRVTVVTDACAAATTEDHERSLHFLPKIAELTQAGDL